MHFYPDSNSGCVSFSSVCHFVQKHRIAYECLYFEDPPYVKTYPSMGGWQLLDFLLVLFIRNKELNHKD